MNKLSLSYRIWGLSVGVGVAATVGVVLGLAEGVRVAVPTTGRVALGVAVAAGGPAAPRRPRGR